MKRGGELMLKASLPELRNGLNWLRNMILPAGTQMQSRPAISLLS